MVGISNKALGEANHQALTAYFDRVGVDIPVRPDGTADIARIVRDVPLTSRAVIYQNERNRLLCNERFGSQGIPPIAARGDDAPGTFQRPGAVEPDEEKKQLRNRVGQLERDLLVARGEVVELRRAMRRYEAIENHLGETGRLPR